MAALIQEELKALAAQKRQLEADQTALEDQREAWHLAQDRLEDLDAWRRNVAANLGENHLRGAAPGAAGAGGRSEGLALRP